MIITPKQPRDGRTVSRLSKLVPYMLRGKGEERCTWYMAGSLPGLDRREDAELAVDVMELLQEGNLRAKGNKTYHLVISFHPEDRPLTPVELEDVVRRSVRAAGLEQHQYIAVRHSEQEHEHLHVAVNKIHPETLKIHHPYKAIHGYQALASALEEELGLHRVDRARGRSQNHKARDFEAHRGIESFSRWARRNIGATKALDRVASWAALHEELTRFGVRLVRRGNGLAIVDATRSKLACKASALGRGWSRQRLCERYGDFVPGPGSAEVTRSQVDAYEERPLGRAFDDGLWREYQHALGAARIHRSELREALEYWRKALDGEDDDGELDRTAVERKIRDAEKEWVPVIAVLGKREVETGAVSLRLRGGEQRTATVEELAARLDEMQGAMPTADLNQPVRLTITMNDH